MIQSMTGYGKGEHLFADHKTIVEIRSVNSKQLDLTLKMCSLVRDKEPEIRAILQKPLERGKVDVTIYTQNIKGEENTEVSYTPINWEAVAYYVSEYKKHAQELGLPVGDTLPGEVAGTILRYPDVLSKSVDNTQQTIEDEEWGLLQETIRQTLEQYLQFRQQEGHSLEVMFTEKLDAIAQLLSEVEPYESSRIDNIRTRLENNLEGLSQKTKVEVDKNRLEAEMIYYLEKLDITEEKVRLTNHIRYFRETMAENGAGVGKKLGFIAQEMGREINTLGSKSNQSEMQVIVVKMKDLLEQIKEQVLNVL